MLSYWAYILIGNNDTGKTCFQKYLVSELCGREYKRLPRNLVTDIVHPRMPRGISTLSTMNRSYQEVPKYGNVANFFQYHFAEADICILSSHVQKPAINQLSQMIRELRLRAYNVAAVFFSNGFNKDAANVSLLKWDDRLWLDNTLANSDAVIHLQIERLAKEFAQLLIARAAQQ